MLDLVHTDHPDEKSVMTYVSSLYEIFPKEPTVQEALHDNVSVYVINVNKKFTRSCYSNLFFHPVALMPKIIKLYFNGCNL